MGGRACEHVGVIVVTRYVVPREEATAFAGLCREAIDALAARPGFLAAQAGQALDDPTLWVLATTWDSVGSYRRALSNADVKMRAVPLMYRAVDEASAFEGRLTAAAGEPVVEHLSALAPSSDAEPGPGPR